MEVHIEISFLMSPSRNPTHQAQYLQSLRHSLSQSRQSTSMPIPLPRCPSSAMPATRSQIQQFHISLSPSLLQLISRLLDLQALFIKRKPAIFAFHFRVESFQNSPPLFFKWRREFDGLALLLDELARIAISTPCPFVVLAPVEREVILAHMSCVLRRTWYGMRGSWRLVCELSGGFK